MKKLLALLLAFCLVLGLAACSGTGNASATPTGTTNAPNATNSPEATAGLKLGMSISTELSGTDASDDGDGNAQADSTVAAVLLDENGVIIDCIIDVAQNKMAFTTAGEVPDKDKEFKTKRELGPDYNMKARSAIGLEWYEQAQGFCDYVIGKTAAEVSGIALNEEGAATDETITATTTIKIGAFIGAVTQACENAKEFGTSAGDKLGLGVFTTMADSVDASADGDGTCFAYSTYCAVTLNADSKVTAATVDATQSKIAVSTEGVITTDLTAAEVLSKNVLKEDYGMKARSGIGLEWYEQAEGFCTYITGMNASEIGGIAVNEEGAPTDEALLATTTVKIGDFLKAGVKAAQDAAAR